MYVQGHVFLTLVCIRARDPSGVYRRPGLGPAGFEPREHLAC